MSFPEILKEKLSDPKYGWEEHKLKTFPDEEALFKMNQAQEKAKGRWSVYPMPPRPLPTYEEAVRELEEAGCKNL